MSEPIGRRRFLKGAAAAGAMALGTAACATAPGVSTAPPTGPLSLTRAAQEAYRNSLSRLRRKVPGADGKEIAELGTGVLSSDPTILRASRNARAGDVDFDVLIIGSGYGGAVCAARLAHHRRPGVKIAVLERGREWVPGTFPDRLFNFLPLGRRPSWMNQQMTHNRLGLFGFYDGDVEVVVGSGLGGTSLTNCAVAIEPEDDVFHQAAWPEELRSNKQLRVYYDMAQDMLVPRVTPAARFTPKLTSHLETARILRAKGTWQAKAYPVHLVINQSPGTNAQGMRQQGCVQCGDCATGCNVGAKNSVDMNYLPLAWQHGAIMFTQVEVETIQKLADGYRVEYLLRPDANRPDREEHAFVTARMVILAAGTMGTSEILLRSRDRGGINVSDSLGKGFSGNGNYLGFADYQYVEPPVLTRTAGVGVSGGAPSNRVGAYIEGAIDFRQPQRPLERRVVIEDIAQASSLAGGVALLMLADLNRGMTLLGCGHDGAAGEIRLQQGRGVVQWPDYERLPNQAEMVRLMTQYAGARGGQFTPFKPARNYTAHPLGGCRMAASSAGGVVNHQGQVFDTSVTAETTAVHPGLYIADASIIPTALGNNPLLTITALAERIAELIVSNPDHSMLFQEERGPRGREESGQNP